MGYLTIAPGTKKEGQKTYTYCVFALASSVFLGIVKWYAVEEIFVALPVPAHAVDCSIRSFTLSYESYVVSLPVKASVMS